MGATFDGGHDTAAVEGGKGRGDGARPGARNPAMSRPEGALREALESRPGVRLAVLFGSAARGTTGPRSDLDVGVILEEGLGLTEVENALARATGRRVEVVRLDTAPPLLRFEIARDACSSPSRSASTSPRTGWRTRAGRRRMTRVDGATCYRRGVINRAVADGLRGATGLRNRIADGYAMMDYRRVQQESREGIPPLRAFLEAVASAAGL